MKQIALALLLALSLTACESGPFSSDVEGYQTLDERLDGEAQATKDVFDAAAAYEPVQIALLNIVTNPNVPDDAKDRVKQVDSNVMSALRAYRASVEGGEGSTDARLRAFLSSLQQAQEIVAQYSQESKP